MLGSIMRNTTHEPAPTTTNPNPTSDRVQRHDPAPQPSDEATPVKVTLVGHSLGGAIAQLVAIRMMADLQVDSLAQNNIACVTFGAPFVGDGRFRRSMESRNWSSRIVNVLSKDDDLIAVFNGAMALASIHDARAAAAMHVFQALASYIGAKFEDGVCNGKHILMRFIGSQLTFAVAEDFGRFDEVNLRPAHTSFEFEPAGKYLLMDIDSSTIEFTTDHRSISPQLYNLNGFLGLNRRVRQHLLKSYEELLEARLPRAKPRHASKVKRLNRKMFNPT